MTPLEWAAGLGIIAVWAIAVDQLCYRAGLAYINWKVRRAGR